MLVQTPEYWKEEKFQPLIEETTAYGNKVKIPKSFQVGWEIERMRMELREKQGWEEMAGLTKERDLNPIYYDMARVFYVIYPGHF